MQDTKLVKTVGFYRASLRKGWKVENPSGEELGILDDMIVDLRDGRILASVLSCADYDGMNGNLVPIPPKALDYERAGNRCILMVPREKLRREAPAFQAGDWESLLNVIWATEMYSRYGRALGFPEGPAAGCPAPGTPAPATAEDVAARGSADSRA